VAIAPLKSKLLWLVQPARRGGGPLRGGRAFDIWFMSFEGAIDKKEFKK